MLRRLGDVLGESVSRMGYSARISESHAMDAWNEEIAPGIRCLSRATLVRARVMHVTVESSVWTQQLAMLKSQLLRKINSVVGGDAIADVRFHTGQVRIDPELEDVADGKEAQTKPPWLDVSLESAAMVEVLKASEPIADPGIRAKFERLLLADMQRRVWLLSNLSPSSRDVIAILRREPWLSNEQIAYLSPKALADDISVARAAAGVEFRREILALVAQGAEAMPEGRMQLRLLAQSIAMLATGKSPEEIDRETAATAIGREYEPYLSLSR